MRIKTAFFFAALPVAWLIVFGLEACNSQVEDPEPIKLDTALAMKILPGERGVFFSSTRCPQMDRAYWENQPLIAQVPFYVDSNVRIINQKPIKGIQLSEDSVAMALPEHYSMVFFKKNVGQNQLSLMIFPQRKTKDFAPMFTEFFGLEK